jgi:hypothetical protein
MIFASVKVESELYPQIFSYKWVVTEFYLVVVEDFPITSGLQMCFS